MPTDAQAETARNIFKAAKKVTPTSSPEPVQPTLLRDKSRAAQLLADINARNTKILEEAGAVPKHSPGESTSKENPPDRTAAAPEQSIQDQTNETVQPQLPSGLPQDVYKVAQGNISQTLRDQLTKIGTKPKTGPRSGT